MIEKNTTQTTLEYFFTYPLREIHLRELTRKLSTSLPTVLITIKKLSKERLVVVTKGRAITTVKANLDSVLFFRLKRISNLERLLVSGLIDALSSAFKIPQAIICFGSYSRGEDIETSDIDIAIIGGTEKQIELEKFEKLLKRRISLHFVKLAKVSEEFKKNLCNGIVLEGAL